MEEILIRLFYIAAIVSWLLTIIEGIAAWLFSPFFFRVGVKIFSEKGRNFNMDKFEIGEVYTTSHAKFKRVSEDSCLFRYREFFFKTNTPFPIKGEVLQDASGSSIIWRIPLGSTLFFLLWLIPWVLGGIVSLFRLDIANGLFSIIVGIGFVLFMIGISIPLESSRTQIALSEMAISAENNLPAKQINISHTPLPKILRTQAGETLSQDITKKQIQDGEHIIKSFIGEKHFSFSKKDFDESQIHFPAEWYCVAITQSALIMTGLDILHRPLNVSRISFQEVNNAKFKKGWFNTDKIIIEFKSKRILELDVNHLFRNQTKAFCSVFNKEQIKNKIRRS